jgi:hypothetical protein
MRYLCEAISAAENPFSNRGHEEEESYNSYNLLKQINSVDISSNLSDVDYGLRRQSCDAVSPEEALRKDGWARVRVVGRQH